MTSITDIAALNEIVAGLKGGQSVTPELLDRFTADCRIEMDVKVTKADGCVVDCVLSLQRGKVTCRPRDASDPSGPPVH
jgi:hypothetical protein